MDSSAHRHALAPYGWNEAVATRFNTVLEPGLEPGRVVRADRGHALVATATGSDICRWSGPAPVTGDWVAVRAGTIARVLERTSAIIRGNARETGDQTLAANVDRAFVVVGLDTRLSLNRLERALTLVWGGGATPVVVLSKADTVDRSLLDHQLTRVRSAAGSVDVIVASAMTLSGLDSLHALAAGGASVVLIGASGVGKSTIGNLLIGAHVLDTGRTRHGDAKGRHTTVQRELFPTARGGVLIDTPGLRSLGLASSSTGIALTFDDIERLAASCRFRDCIHDTEPGCAVAAEVAPRRLESYRKLKREQAAAERRSVVRARHRARRDRQRYDRRRGW